MQMNATRGESTVLLWADHRRWELKTHWRSADNRILCEWLSSMLR
jgi:hypothetical protein